MTTIMYSLGYGFCCSPLTSMTPVEPFLGFKIYLVMRLGLTAVYYLAPSIVGVVIVVVLSSMWKTEARCFFMVTVPFYYLTNLLCLCTFYSNKNE